MIEKFLQSHSNPVNPQEKNIGIVMAAGHGKRIKSSLPKVAHLVWGRPSVKRVLDAIQAGLKSNNQIIVVGRQAEQVVSMIGSKKGRAFSYQKEQLGTGHAIQQGIKEIPSNYQGNIYIFPGDAGLIDGVTIAFFKKEFEKRKFHMMMLTGKYLGPIENNYYGRIVRVPEFDCHKNPVPKEDQGQVIAIIQHQDILSMKNRDEKTFIHRERKYCFTKDQLLQIREFDSVIFAIQFSALRKHINKISPLNSQKEFYLTDLVELFNQNGLSVGSVTPTNHEEVLIGFNDKTVLRKIEDIYRSRCFDQIKNIVDIEDRNRFFIEEKIVNQLIRKDRRSGPLDIGIGGDVFLSGNITLSKGVILGHHTRCEGNIEIGEGATIGDHVQISNWNKQKIIIGKDVKINGHNIIKGNVVINAHTRIGKMVNITGSDEHPTIIGEHSTILGSCYLFGSKLMPQSYIETSILIKKKIDCRDSLDNSKKNKITNKQMALVPQEKIIPVRFVIPSPEGENAVSNL